MSFLDVSEVLSDPDIADGFVVKRRSEMIGQDGCVGVDVKTFGPKDGAVGTICDASPNDLKRLPDEQHTERHISIITGFRLRATTPDYQPDLVGWQGDFYIVRDVQPYTHFGAGFVQAICGSIDYQDAPPSEAEDARVTEPGTDVDEFSVVEGDAQ